MTKKSSLKRVRLTLNRTLRNNTIKSTLKTAIKQYEQTLSADAQNAKDNLIKAISLIDKAVSKGVLHKNTAARKKSRLTKKLNKIAG